MNHLARFTNNGLREQLLRLISTTAEEALEKTPLEDTHLRQIIRRPGTLRDHLSEVFLRMSSGPLDAAPSDAGKSFRRGPLELQLDGSRAYWGGRMVKLTITEFNIVKMMAVDAPRDFSYRDIYDVVHGKNFVAGYGPSGYRANVRAFIKRIRINFKTVDPTFDEIENYPGFGYHWLDRNPGTMTAT